MLGCRRLAMTVVTMSRKRPRFKKITDRGWDTIKALSDSPLSLKIWIFITKHADMYNSLVAPVAVLAEECGWIQSTSRHIPWPSQNRTNPPPP